MEKRKSLISFRSINEIIDSEKEFEKLREVLKNYNIVEEFERIFPELSNIATAKKAEKQILYLRVENSVWKSELNLQKNILINKINKYFGKEVIKGIKFI